jgi:hypothetical protein
MMMMRAQTKGSPRLALPVAAIAAMIMSLATVAATPEMGAAATPSPFASSDSSLSTSSLETLIVGLETELGNVVVSVECIVPALLSPNVPDPGCGT